MVARASSIFSCAPAKNLLKSEFVNQLGPKWVMRRKISVPGMGMMKGAETVVFGGARLVFEGVSIGMGVHGVGSSCWRMPDEDVEIEFKGFAVRGNAADITARRTLLSSSREKSMPQTCLL